MKPGLTYSKTQWDQAQDAWASGDFSEEWTRWRRLAADGPGIIYPPEGTPWDDWSADDPSQRALIIRAIRETPELLHWAITSTKRPSWGIVVGKLLEGRDELRDQRDVAAARDEQERATEPNQRQAVYSLKHILTIIGDS